MGMLDEFNVNFVEVPSDDQGMMARELDEVLSAWPADRRKPKFVYTIPTGSNPSGTCASEARKMDLLRVVKKHDIMLCEDDAYFYLVSLTMFTWPSSLPTADSTDRTFCGQRITVFRSTAPTQKLVGYGKGSKWRDGPCCAI